MRFALILIFSIIVCLVLNSSCNKYPVPQPNGCTYAYYKCLNIRILPCFSGYSQSEIDTLILKTYKADNSFATLLNEKTFTKTDTYYVYNNAKEIVFESLYLYYGNDYEIFLPGVNKTYRIYGITETGNDSEFVCDRLGCSKDLDSIQHSGGTIQMQLDAGYPEYYLSLPK